MTRQAPRPDPNGRCDVAIVGGGFAGLSAALPVARARRGVIVLDNGAGRNRLAAASHGLLASDGRAPAEIRAAGQRDLAAYPNASFVSDRVVQIGGELDRFELATDGGRMIRARRVILAYGMTDLLPPIDGVAACWGRSVTQCPYCHGYELADQRTGVLVTAPESLHQARILPDWSSDLFVLANGQPIQPGDRKAFAARGLRVVDGRVVALEHDDGRLGAVVLDNGDRLPLEVLYLITRSVPAATLADQLGCRAQAGPFGAYLAVDPLRETSVPGVYAAGDLARPVYNAVWAAADGARAGIFCHQSLAVAQNPWRERID